MTDQDYIRKAVELADGWEIDNQEDGDAEYDYLSQAGNMEWHFNEDPMWVNDIPEIFIDALAAQLVRQVDSVAGYDLVSYTERAEIESDLQRSPDGKTICRSWRVVAQSINQGRTMNTLKAIIDSGVLNKESK